MELLPPPKYFWKLWEGLKKCVKLSQTERAEETEGAGLGREG